MKIILPPILFIALLPTMWILSLFDSTILKAVHNSGTPYWEIGICASLGCLFLIGARLQFKKEKSEIMTFNQPQNLVTKGLFRISRNPMYLGFLLLLIAFALYINIWLGLIAPLIFFTVANYWYIPYEEKAAVEVFGDSYRNYKEKVRKWI